MRVFSTRILAKSWKNLYIFTWLTETLILVTLPFRKIRKNLEKSVNFSELVGGVSHLSHHCSFKFLLSQKILNSSHLESFLNSSSRATTKEAPLVAAIQLVAGLQLAVETNVSGRTRSNVEQYIPRSPAYGLADWFGH